MVLTWTQLLTGFGSPWSGFGTEALMRSLMAGVAAAGSDAAAAVGAAGENGSALSSFITGEEALALASASATFGSPWGGLGGVGSSMKSVASGGQGRHG